MTALRKYTVCQLRHSIILIFQENVYHKQVINKCHPVVYIFYMNKPPHDYRVLYYKRKNADGKI